jgi:hypothetical protein
VGDGGGNFAFQPTRSYQKGRSSMGIISNTDATLVPAHETPGPLGFTSPPPAPPMPQRVTDEATRLRGQLCVATLLLQQCIGPLEVAAALCESDHLESLARRTQAFVAARAPCHRHEWDRDLEAIEIALTWIPLDRREPARNAIESLRSHLLNHAALYDQPLSDSDGPDGANREPKQC